MRIIHLEVLMDGLQKWLITKFAYDLAIKSNAGRDSLDEVEQVTMELCRVIPDDGFMNGVPWKKNVEEWTNRPLGTDFAAPGI